jgi:hypothetical protein
LPQLHFLLFFSSDTKLQPVPLDIPKKTSNQTGSNEGKATASFDRAKWDALVKYDKDIASISEKLKPLGQKWMDEFASSYLALNDKTYLPEIEKKIFADAKIEKEINEIKRNSEKEQYERKRIYEEEQQRAFSQEQERLTQEQKKRLELWKNLFWGNTRRKMLTVTCCVVVIVLIVLAFQLITGSKTPITNPSRQTVALPMGNSGRQAAPTTSHTPASEKTFTVATAGGGTIKTKDFIHNGITIPSDDGLPGSYILAGSHGYCSDNPTKCRVGPGGNFSIQYNAKADAFNITIGEPLMQSRHAVEQFLMKTLGITRGEICRLKYSVGTTSGEDYLFAGKELGFSFCPGAVVLPSKPSNRHIIRPG